MRKASFTNTTNRRTLLSAMAAAAAVPAIVAGATMIEIEIETTRALSWIFLRRPGRTAPGRMTIDPYEIACDKKSVATGSDKLRHLMVNQAICACFV
jgi:hypothetical protein